MTLLYWFLCYYSFRCYFVAVLKQVSGKRNDLRLIISSATLDAEKFSKYFYNAAVFEIAGRMFPVDIEYVHHFISDSTYVNEAAKAVLRINEREEQGDILVFMSGLYYAFKMYD